MRKKRAMMFEALATPPAVAVTDGAMATMVPVEPVEPDPLDLKV